MEQTKVQKWGNSLAVRLPRTITRTLRFREGTPVLIGQDQMTVLIKHVMPRTPRDKQWKQFIIPTKKKKQCVSENVDKIVYGASR